MENQFLDVVLKVLYVKVLIRKPELHHKSSKIRPPHTAINKIALYSYKPALCDLLRIHYNSSAWKEKYSPRFCYIDLILSLIQISKLLQWFKVLVHRNLSHPYQQMVPRLIEQHAADLKQ